MEFLNYEFCSISLQICYIRYLCLCANALKEEFTLWGFYLFICLFMNRFVILDHLVRHQMCHITHSACVLMLVANCSLDPCGPSVMNINEGKFTS